MPKPELVLYQNQIQNRLRLIYPNNPIETPIRTEWTTITNIPGLYSPRLDIAVGPFSTVRGQNQIDVYNNLMDNSRQFIERLIHYHTLNITNYRIDDDQLNQALILPNFDLLNDFNQNARCFIAIEIENSVSRKHLLGGALNAAALGRIGIVIGWTEEKLRALIKLQSYWDFLRSVDKPTFYALNLILLSPNQLIQAIEDAIEQY